MAETRSELLYEGTFDAEGRRLLFRQVTGASGLGKTIRSTVTEHRELKKGSGLYMEATGWTIATQRKRATQANIDFLHRTSREDAKALVARRLSAIANQADQPKPKED